MSDLYFALAITNKIITLNNSCWRKGLSSLSAFFVRVFARQVHEIRRKRYEDAMLVRLFMVILKMGKTQGLFMEKYWTKKA